MNKALTQFEAFQAFAKNKLGHKNRIFAYLLLLALSGGLASCGGDEPAPAQPSIPARAATKVYFTDYSAKTLGVVDLSNTRSFTTLADNVGKGLYGSSGVVFDAATGYLYIAEEEGDRILRLKNDGSDALTVLYDASDGVDEPTSLAINPATNTLYWANAATSQITRGDLTGTTPPVALYGGASVVSYSNGMAIDPANNKLYFSDYGDATIERAIFVGNLDGTGIPEVLYQENMLFMAAPSAIAIDPKRGKIYVACKYSDTIVSANLDGSGNFSTLFEYEDGVYMPEGLAIDTVGNKIYWTETSSSLQTNHVIARGNLDGTGAREVILGGVKSSALTLAF